MTMADSAPLGAPKFVGKAAIVTGSTSGIGLACAEAFAREGAHTVVSGSRAPDSEGAREAVAKVEAAAREGARVIYVQADLRKAQESAVYLVEECVKAFGTVHILINNAGIQHVCSTDDFPAEKWDDLMAVNLSAPFHLIQQSLSHMKKNEGKWGRIVNVSSVHGVVASINKPAYCASKHGLNGLTKVVALENAADTKIVCNSVCPGWVLTPLVEKQIQARAEQKSISYEAAVVDLVGEKQPTQRFTTADQIADMCVFLSSESASNMTGTINVMDGGWHVQ